MTYINYLQGKFMKVKILTAGAVALVMFTGCGKFSDSGTFIPSPKDVGNMMFADNKSPQELIAQSNDKDLTKAFLDVNDTSITSKNMTPSTILLERKRLYRTDSYIYFSKSRDFYRNLAFDFLNDDITKTYIKTIEARENSYIIYNGNVNKKFLESLVGGNLKKGDSKEGEVYMYDSDFCIIEYDKEGNKISTLTRQARIEPSSLGMSMGDRDPAVTIHQNVFIFLQPEVRKAELNLSSVFLEENVYKKVGSYFSKQTTSQTDKTKESKTEQIKELHQMYKDGILTEDEFKTQKQKILNSENMDGKQQKKSSSTSLLPNDFESRLIEKFNSENNTNFKTMQEVQEYLFSRGQSN